MLQTIPETDLDGVNIQAKMFNILKHLVNTENSPQIVISEDMNNDFYYYRNLVVQMIQNNKTTLSIDYNHLAYVDSELSEVIYFYYYKVNLIVPI